MPHSRFHVTEFTHKYVPTLNIAVLTSLALLLFCTVTLSTDIWGSRCECKHNTGSGKVGQIARVYKHTNSLASKYCLWNGSVNMSITVDQFSYWWLVTTYKAGRRLGWHSAKGRSRINNYFLRETCYRDTSLRCQPISDKPISDVTLPVSRPV